MINDQSLYSSGESIQKYSEIWYFWEVLTQPRLWNDKDWSSSVCLINGFSLNVEH